MSALTVCIVAAAMVAAAIGVYTLARPHLSTVRTLHTHPLLTHRERRLARVAMVLVVAPIPGPLDEIAAVIIAATLARRVSRRRHHDG